ncbi:MAG: hypothetical protein FWD76_06125, partial [Firmicutes bacterium]|nr:hypothetical protein [Bacillota bacterium]
KGFAPKIVDNLAKDTLAKLMSYLGNPKALEPYARKGLVIGDVQSGKTANYIGLICKAVDAGYRVIFLLTGTIESLRRQTQIRVEEGFIGYDVEGSQDCGVGKGNIVPHSFTTRTQDFGKDAGNSTALLISDNETRPYIFVIKKNVSVLKNIHRAIHKNLKQSKDKVKFPMLMIDDEADNASINTKKAEEDPTQTNKHIRNLLALFEKSNYVGFTATPFANVFVNPQTDDDMLGEDLFPKDFIFALSPPSNYHGAKKMFVDDGESSDKSMLCVLDKTTEQADKLWDWMPTTHKKEYRAIGLSDSLCEAIDRFLLCNALRDISVLREGVRYKGDEDKNTHRSMLVNVSRFVAVQDHIASLIQEYLDTTKNNIRQSWKLTKNEALTNPCVGRLHTLFCQEFALQGISWEVVFEVLYDAIKGIQVLSINSKSEKKLDYLSDKKGCRVIAVGGLALSRGLTLEGLMVSYFYRNSATFDVLMQMGRWFGYRQGYEDLCKVYLTKTSKIYYKEIIESTEQLKQDMRTMCEQKKKPVEFGIRIRNNFWNGLRITAVSKMRNTGSKTVTKDFFGEMFYTPILDYGSDNAHNIAVTQDLIQRHLAKKDDSVRHPYYRDIAVEDIKDFLKKLKINEKANDNLDTKQLVAFLEREPSIRGFDILLMGGSEDEIEFSASSTIKPARRRYRLLPDSTLLQINHNRIGSNKDTAFGLSPEKIREIKNQGGGDNDKDYLIPDRNPLLLVYMIAPSNFKSETNGVTLESEDDEIDNMVAFKDKQTVKEWRDFENERKNSSPCLIGYQIGFPKNENHTKGNNERYIVNINADYYKSQDEDDGGDVE